MKLSVNLAAAPFRNQRIPGLLVALLALFLMGLTLLHLASLLRVMPQSTSASLQEFARLDNEASQLRAQLAAAPAEALDSATGARWISLKNIVDRRVFDWPMLLARLEAALPGGARLASITPELKNGRVLLTLSGAAHNLDDVEKFGRNLEAQPFFVTPTPLDFGQTEDEKTFTYAVEYRADATAAAPAAAQATPPPQAPRPGRGR